jgi:hypothetical protein
MSRYKIIAALSIVLLIVISSLILVRELNCKQSGMAASASQLPRYRELDGAPWENIQYKYDCSTGRLLTKGAAQKSAFDDLQKRFNLSVIEYLSGVESSSTFVSDVEFLPQGSRVWSGQGSLRKEGRRHIFVYFVPEKEGSAIPSGMLYVHIL